MIDLFRQVLREQGMEQEYLCLSQQIKAVQDERHKLIDAERKLQDRFTEIFHAGMDEVNKRLYPGA